MPGPTRRAKRPRSRAELPAGEYARYDLDRGRRTGTPEVVLAEGKSIEHLLGILRTMQAAGHGALVSRPTPSQTRALRRAGSQGLPIDFLAGGRIVRLRGPLGAGPVPGTIALLTAGTADVPVAEEANAVLEELGVRVLRSHDVGVAGIHRLERALRRIERRRPSAYLVFAGREGALPTVVAGLVRAPVIGVPTSIGYGRGGRG
jgi:NCAIR mutase (PurE)-related protein